LIPTEPLPVATGFALIVRAGAPSAEGPGVTPADQGGGFQTYGPLQIVEHHCWYQEPCPPTAEWSIRFANPLDAAKTDVRAIRVSPEVPGLSVRVVGDSLQLGGAFVGRTAYTVTVPASVTDSWGQTLGHSEDVVFRVGPADKTLDATGDTMVVLDPAGQPAGGAVLPVWSTNHPGLKVTIHRVEPGDYPAWLRWVQRFWYEDARPGPLPGDRVFSGVLTPTVDRDRRVETPIPFGPYLRDGAGQFVVLVEPTVQPKDRWNRQYLYKWVQVTRLGLVAFVDGDAVTGWATDLATGDPVEGASFVLADGGGAAVASGADGLAVLALPRSGADHSNVLVARRGPDLALLPEATSPWNGTGWIARSELDQLRWYVADDRGLYKPGEHARIKGWLRRWEPGPTGDVAGLAGSADATIDWSLTDPVGNPIGTGKAPVSKLGGFALDIPLPADVNLGTANLVLSAGGIGDATGTVTSHPLQIQEFRRPEFEVTSEIDADRHVLGERARVDLTAAYYAGGGLPDAEVNWTVYASPASYAPPGWASYTFGSWTPWWLGGWERGGFGKGRGYAYGSGELIVGQLAATTDGTGAHHLGIHFAGLAPARPMTVRAEGTVLDVNRQAWTTSATTLVHPADRYVGLRTGRAFVDPTEPIEVELAVVGIDGAAAAGATAELRFARLDWGPTAT
ncbi:MAG: MG2 domain-containing protein, partial [Myxococcota bacterium]